MATLLQCKLCSATNNLISLFSGKCVKNRNYIRKLVAVTTGIKFTENGIFSYICFTCIVQIYNFHIFKIRSAQNEDRLQSINSNFKRRTFKYKIPSIDDIKLPDLDELKDTLGNWLLSKRETLADYSEQEESQREENSDLSTRKGAEKDCCNKTSFTQTIIDTADVETQCDVTKKITISSTQTDIFSKCNVKIQCDLKNTLKTESYTQTEFQIVNNINTTNFSTQTHTILKSNVEIQCGLENKLKKTSRTQTESKTANVATQTEVATNSNCIKTLVDSKIQKNCPADLIKTEGNCRANKSQITNNLKSNRLSYVQNIYINQKLIDSPSIKNEATTISLNNKKEMSNVGRSLRLSSKANVTNNGNKDMITNIADNMKCPTILTEEMITLQHSPLNISPIKEELKSPTPSPCSPLLASPEIIPDTDENEDAKTSSPDNLHVSLLSCNLLAIKKRVQPVQICKYCDLTIYSKYELKLHMKVHLTCSFCKKTFSDVKKTRIHMDFECQQKVASLPVIKMVRIEQSKELQETFPQVHLKLKEIINARKEGGKRKSAPVNSSSKKQKLK